MSATASVEDFRDSLALTQKRFESRLAKRRGEIGAKASSQGAYLSSGTLLLFVESASALFEEFLGDIAAEVERFSSRTELDRDALISIGKETATQVHLLLPELSGVQNILSSFKSPSLDAVMAEKTEALTDVMRVKFRQLELGISDKPGRQMDMAALEHLANDEVSLVGADGDVKREGVRANCQPNLIIIPDSTLPIDTGDHLLRKRPGGMVDDFIVEDPGYLAAVGSFAAHFQVKVRRSDAPAADRQVTINKIAGNNARINISSTDNSTNFVSGIDTDLFVKLVEAIRTGVADTQDRENLIEAVQEMQSASDGGRYTGAYQKFVQLAANHMTLLGPYMPALANFLA